MCRSRGILLCCGNGALGYHGDELLIRLAFPRVPVFCATGAFFIAEKSN